MGTNTQNRGPGLLKSSAIALAITALAIPAPAPSAAAADASPAYGAELQGFDYPYPVSHFHFQSQGVAMDMAFMDVATAHPNGQTAVPPHGKNFCAATWQTAIERLAGAGHHVIAPDQAGFRKSTPSQ